MFPIIAALVVFSYPVKAEFLGDEDALIQAGFKRYFVPSASVSHRDITVCVL